MHVTHAMQGPHWGHRCCVLVHLVTGLRCRAVPHMAAVSAPQRPSTLPPLGSIRGVLFDIDGTLCDSDPLHYQAFRDALQEKGFNGGAPITREFFDEHISGGHNSVLGYDELH